MVARKSHYMSPMWASFFILFFAAAATIVIVSWSPMLPEAIAVEMNWHTANTANSTNNFSSYVALHQTESWHQPALLGALTMIADCPK